MRIDSLSFSVRQAVHQLIGSAILTKRMTNRHLTDSEVERIRRRRAAVRASLACEGIYLTEEEEKLFDRMDEERLTPDERAERIRQFCRSKRGEPAST